MYRLPKLLSTAEAADIADLAESSVRTYRTRGQTPPPDATIGSTPGWLPATIEAWAETLPGRGARTDLPQPATDQAVADPIAAARDLLALIRSCVDTSALDAPDPRPPYRNPVQQAGWTAAGHLARAGAAYEALPWQTLAAELGGDLYDPDDAEQAMELLRAVQDHVARARAKLSVRRSPPDWDDHVAVLGEMEHIARRAADLRMVTMLESLLLRHTDEEVAR